MLNLLLIALPAVLGGFVQGMTGFGCGIVIMLFLPMVLAVQKASALCMFAACFLNVSMVYTYRKHINWKLCVKPWIFYFPVFYMALSAAAKVDTNFLKPILGLFLVAMSVYCVCFADKIKLSAGWGSAAVCTCIGAFVDAFFGIGGPPMVLYFLGTTDDKEEYLGSIQAFFLVSSFVASVMRIMSGIIEFGDAKYVFALVCSMIIGRTIGGRFVKKIDQALMKKLVYGFIGVAGLITFIANISSLIK